MTVGREREKKKKVISNYRKKISLCLAEATFRNKAPTEMRGLTGWLRCHCLEEIPRGVTFGSLPSGMGETEAAILGASPRGSELRASAYASWQRTHVPGKMQLVMKIWA